MPGATADDPGRLVLVLAVAVVGICLGHAWQCLRWDTPLWALLWDESTMRGVVQTLLGMEWAHWAASDRVEGAIATAGIVWGWLFVGGAMAAAAWPGLVGRPGLARRLAAVLLCCASGSLLLWTLLTWHDHNQEWPQIFERAAQVAAPLLLLRICRMGSRAWRLTALIAVGLTFLGHACYALGWPRLPGHFVAMLMRGAGLDQPTAIGVLHLVGVLDVLAVAALCWGRTRRIGLWWMVIWGLATAVARVIGTIDPAFLISGLEQYLHQAVLRLVHGLLPLVLLLLRPVPLARVAGPPRSADPATEPSCAPSPT